MASYENDRSEIERLKVKPDVLVCVVVPAV
jgi:hypothetical protein